MSLRTSRLRSGLGHPMSDKMVDTRPVEQHEPSISPPLSHAHPGQWIRRHNIRYTLQGAPLSFFNHAPPTMTYAPLTSNSHRVPPTVLRPSNIPHRLQENPSHNTTRHTAPNRDSGRSSLPRTNNKPMSHQTWSCVAKTRNLLRTRHPNL
jgi:hypothetical protein